MTYHTWLSSSSSSTVFPSFAFFDVLYLKTLPRLLLFTFLCFAYFIGSPAAPTPGSVRALYDWRGSYLINIIAYDVY